MANFTITPETIRFSPQRSSGQNRAANNAGADQNESRWRPFTKKVGRWMRRLLLAPIPDWSPRRKKDAPSESEERHATFAVYDALSEDGPFRRITAEEAHRHVVFACVYYALLGLGILAMVIFH
jgi:hypothetical protein